MMRNEYKSRIQIVIRYMDRIEGQDTGENSIQFMIQIVIRYRDGRHKRIQ